MTTLTRRDILGYLKIDDSGETEELFRRARLVRENHFDREVHVRGLLNFSNYCVGNCLYCGFRADNKNIERFRMSDPEILDAVDAAVQTGYKTVLMQSGEDPFYTDDVLAGLIKEIKSRYPDLALALSAGERSARTFQQWFDLGLDRYLLRFETSDEKLYSHLRPGRKLADRLEQIRTMKQIGYAVASGMQVGLPGQTWESLADDVMLLSEMGVDMLGVGPHIHNPHTPMPKPTSDRTVYVKSNEETVLKVTAVLRILTGDTLIPVTTALSSISEDSVWKRAFEVGANVVMFDITPPEYKMKYLIYPREFFTDGIGEYDALKTRLENVSGLSVSTGRGDRPGWSRLESPEIISWEE